MIAELSIMNFTNTWQRASAPQYRICSHEKNRKYTKNSQKYFWNEKYCKFRYDLFVEYCMVCTQMIQSITGHFECSILFFSNQKQMVEFCCMFSSNRKQNFFFIYSKIFMADHYLLLKMLSMGQYKMNGISNRTLSKNIWMDIENEFNLICLLLYLYWTFTYLH